MTMSNLKQTEMTPPSRRAVTESSQRGKAARQTLQQAQPPVASGGNFSKDKSTKDLVRSSSLRVRQQLHRLGDKTGSRVQQLDASLSATTVVQPTKPKSPLARFRARGTNPTSDAIVTATATSSASEASRIPVPQSTAAAASSSSAAKRANVVKNARGAPTLIMHNFFVPPSVPCSVMSHGPVENGTKESGQPDEGKSRPYKHAGSQRQHATQVPNASSYVREAGPTQPETFQCHDERIQTASHHRDRSGHASPKPISAVPHTPLHSNCKVAACPTSASSDLTEKRLKAMQLGVFKINDQQLRERYQFLHEIGAGQWGSIWAVEALKHMSHLPESAYRTRQVVKLTGHGTYTVDNSAHFRPLAVKLCQRDGKHSSAARTKHLWNEFKILRTIMDQQPRAQPVDPSSPNLRVRHDCTGWHPSIVNFYEFLLTPKLAMVVMPKYDAPVRVCLPDATCRSYFQQLVSAVHWLQQYSVCHNDIKVDNLLVSFDTNGLGRDNVTLVDFGFANRYDPAAENAFMSTDVWGTPEYLAPERLRGKLHDERFSDVWALGITFFEICTGRTPFERHDEKFNSDEKFEEYYRRAERGTWLGEWDFAPDIEDLVRKMLHVDPKRRLNAAGALLHPCLDPCSVSRCDSFDELLQIPYDESAGLLEHLSSCEKEGITSPDATGETDRMLGELLLETRQASVLDQAPDGTLQSTPGVGRSAAVPSALFSAAVPMSPSLSQVGMDSRLTDLMCASPPWKRVQCARTATPIPSGLKQLSAVSIESSGGFSADSDQETMDEPNASFSSEDYQIAVANAAKSTPTRTPTPAKALIPETDDAVKAASIEIVREPLRKTPLDSAGKDASSEESSSGRSVRDLPQQAKSFGGGNKVASLAKKFDASSFLSRSQPARFGKDFGQISIKETAGGTNANHKGMGHRRSKSYNDSQVPVSRHTAAVRRSLELATGPKPPNGPRVVSEGIGMHARLFGDRAYPPRSAGPTHRRTLSSMSKTDSTVNSVILRSFDEADGSPKPAARSTEVEPDENITPEPVATTSLVSGHGQAWTDCTKSPTRMRHSNAERSKQLLLSAPVSSRVSKHGHRNHVDERFSSPREDEVIVSKLRKMASLASMLTRMIDETKSTILSPGRSRLYTDEASRDALDVGASPTPARSSSRASTLSLSEMTYSNKTIESVSVSESGRTGQANSIGTDMVRPKSLTKQASRKSVRLAPEDLAKLPKLTTSSVGVAQVSVSGSGAKPPTASASAPSTSQSTFGRKSVRKSIALENATFEILNVRENGRQEFTKGLTYRGSVAGLSRHGGDESPVVSSPTPARQLPSSLPRLSSVPNSHGKSHVSQSSSLPRISHLAAGCSSLRLPAKSPTRAQSDRSILSSSRLPKAAVPSTQTTSPQPQRQQRQQQPASQPKRLLFGRLFRKVS
ncbi:hypothetical protein BCV70DRAFT_11381 [Testicularia cyperi]|uniref:Protein kinase domain-containing protein n=1 Tax=Testicularia cyperi TaxID=1882483 RepID=A0A317XZ59_9BASI|nr:hypothetical protein BCV70DRAFT_11381 [Testicularia cyperi]